LKSRFAALFLSPKNRAALYGYDIINDFAGIINNEVNVDEDKTRKKTEDSSGQAAPAER
jgi:hypothetical protein